MADDGHVSDPATIITQCKKTVSALILTHVAKLVL